MIDDLTIQNPSSQLDPDLLNAAYSPAVRKTVRGGDKLQGVKPELVEHWNGLQQEFSKAGVAPEIKSGFRTAEQQNALFRNPATRAKTKGNDGYSKISPHQRGEALDISFPAYQRNKGRQIIADYAKRNGLHIPSDEPWHISLGRPQQTPNLDPDLVDAGYGQEPSAPAQAIPQSVTPQLDPDLLSAAYGEDAPQTPKTPQVTSTVREADTGAALPVGEVPQPKPVAPVQFKQGTGLRAPTGAADYLATIKETQEPRDAYQEPGAAIRLPFSPHVTPSKDEIERAVVRSFGSQYEALNDQYRKDAQERYGQAENLVKLPESVKQEPDGSVIVGASQGAVDFLNAYAKDGIAGVEALQKPGAHAFQAAKPRSAMGKISDVGSDLLQYLNIDTPGGLKSDFPRGIAHAVSLGAVGEPREVGREEKILNPQAEATANLSRGAGEVAGALLPFVAAGKILAPLELAKPVQTAAQFGLVDAGKQVVNLAKGRPVDWTSPIVSAGIGTAIGHLEGADPGTIRKVVAFIAPQLAVDAATGVPREQAIYNATQNMLFALGTGGERVGPDARTQEVQSREALGIERAATEGLTPEAREAKVQPYFLRDDQGNPVARILNPEEYAAGAKPKVRPIHPADTAARDEGGRFAEKPEVLSEPLRQPVPEQVAATEAPQVEPAKPEVIRPAQSASEIQTKPPEAVETPSPAAVTPTAPTVAAPKPEPISEVEATGIPSSPESSVREPLARQGQVEEGQITSIKNAAVEARREVLELPNLTPADHQAWEEAGNKAREQGLDTPDKADAIAEQVNNGTKKLLTAEESAGLRDRIRGIENDYQKLAKQTDGESDPEKLANLKADGDVLRERYRVLTDASKKAGTDIARALAIRRSAVDQDMLLTQLGAEQSYKLTTGKEPTAEVQKQIKDLVDENARLKTQLDAHEEARKLKAQEKDINKVIVEKKIEIRRTGRKRAHDDLIKERADIKQQIAQAWAKMKPKSSTFSAGGLGDLDPEGELSRALGDLARNYIEDGVIKASEIVDAIHEQIKDVADLTKRQVSDLISGYGQVKESIRDPVERKLNEIKSILAATSGKADVLEQEIRPLRRGQQREKPTEDQRRALRELEDAMRQKGPQLARQPYDVRSEQASPLDKAKTTARNRQEQLEQWIADGKREVDGRQQIIPDAELKQIKAENAALEKVVALLNDPAADQKAIELRVDALNRQLVKARTNIASGKTTQAREGAKSAWSPEIGALMKERAALSRIASDLRAAETRKARAAEKNKPTGIYGVEGSWADFEARAKRALASRARMEKQISEYQRKIKEQDFSTKERPEPVYDREGNALRAKLEKVRRDFTRLKEKSQTTTVLDALVRWKRFAVLGYGTTIGKLTTAAGGRMAATPLYESLGQVGKRVMPKTFAEEPSTRGFLKGEAAAVKQLWNGDSLRDFLSHLKGGEDLIELLYGKEGGDEFLKSSGGSTYIPRSVGEVMDRPGHLHAALKTVPKRAAFFRHFERALDAEVNKPNPRDISDPMVQLEIAGEAKAYVESKRAILQHGNPVTELFNRAVQAAGSSKYRLARVIGKALQLEYPITKVPANYVGEVATHIGGLPAGLGEVATRGIANKIVRPMLRTEAETRLGKVRRNIEKRLPQAIDDLEPEQRQRIARAIKTGGVGLGFLVWGAMRPDQFGGYYQPGKRDPKDVKFGGMRFMGIDIPRWMGHIPPLEAAQFGATLRRVSDSLIAKQKTKTEAFTEAGKEAIRGLAEEVPFIDPMLNSAHGVGAVLGKEGEQRKFIGGELRSMIPGAVQQGAKALDYPEGTSITQRLNPFGTVDPTSRRPESIAQEAEMGIPFLRQTVPISKVFGARPTKASGEVQRLGVRIEGIVKQPDESSREFALRQARVNPYIRKTLEAVVSSPEYAKASDEDKTEWLKQAAAGGRRAGEANEPEKPEKPEKKEFPVPDVPRPLSRSRSPFVNRFMTRSAPQSV